MSEIDITDENQLREINEGRSIVLSVSVAKLLVGLLTDVNRSNLHCQVNNSYHIRDIIEKKLNKPT